MLLFFLHKKIWLPLLLLAAILMIIEFLLRAGFYNNFLSPGSFLKHSIERKAAIHEFGKENIHWITLGDSRTDGGLKHHLIQKEQNKQGLSHIRLSFDGSYLPAYQTLSNWSLDNLPNFQGILLGMPISNFSRKYNSENQDLIAWAFKDYLPAIYNNQKTKSELKPFLYLYNKTYFSTFLPDIKDFAKNLSIRLKQYKHNQGHRNSLFKVGIKAKHKRNLCKYQLDTLKSCQLTAKNLSTKTNQNKIEQKIIKFCGKNTNKKKLDDLEVTNYVEQWYSFFYHYLDKGISMTIILFPEHPVFNYMLNPEGTEEIRKRTLELMSNKDGFRVIDLRNIFKEQNIPSCSVFSDMVHFNATGRKYFSDALIKEIEREPLK